MDFTFSDDQLALEALATSILGDHCPVDRIKEIEHSEERLDRDLWHHLAESNLLGLSLPESLGGVGLGFVESCIVAVALGSRVAPVPIWPTIVAALTLATHGTSDAHADLVRGVADGTTILTVALDELGAADPLHPSVEATRDEDGRWVLHGTKVAVPAATVAHRILVTARAAGSSPGVFLIDPAADGVTIEAGDGIAHGLDGLVTLDGVTVAATDALGEVVAWMVDRARVMLCAIQVGVGAEAVRMAADYTSNREQFGRPLSTNQGVAMEIADAHIAIEAMRVTMWHAAWRLDHGLDATSDVLVATWWAATGGRRALHLTSHVHGGIGVDIDYPFHRYYLWAKQIEVMLGGPSRQLAWLGAELAEVRT